MSGRRIGNYLITEYIGGGGFGSVFKAEDTTQPGRIVAIKELHKKHTRNTVIKQRFFQEAVAMARLDHPNLPRLYTFGEDNGCYYLVMEFISGRVLADELHEAGAMTADLSAAILAQVLEAVSYAHRNGIIHRDLKPDNIILIDDNGTLRVKVLDFGIARLVGGESLTLAGEGFGTPAYMSPERMWGNISDDPRIDIYAIGIILFEMLTGRPPFQSGATDPVVYWSEMRALHESTPLPPLATLGVPADLQRIITRATAKRVEDRYASADEMLDELKCVKGAGVAAQMAETLLAPTGLARLMLTTVPGGAEVYVDDTLRGTSDAIRGKILIEQLPPGLRAVKVSKQGYSDYKISVALEASRQTDLQVSLAARATAMMPPVEVTAAGSFGTEKFANPATSRTAVVLESLPAGSTVFLGSEAVAAADEDGRVTLQLPPGAHAVRITDPNGASASTVIHVTEADSGLLKTVAMPVEAKATPTARPALPTNKVAAQASTPLAHASTRAATSLAGSAASAARPAARPAPVAIRPEASPQGRRIAYAVIAVLLIALAAGAFIVFRRPARDSVQLDAAPVQPAGVTPDAAPLSAADSAAKATDPNAAQSNAERAALEKRRAEAERKQKEEEQKSASSEPTPAAPAAATAPETPAPPTPTAPAQAEAEAPAAAGTTCLVIWVAGASGEMAPADLRVTVIEQPDTAAAAIHNGRTNEKGRLRKCGLTSGHMVRAMVFGPRGAVLGSHTQTLNAGLNIMQIQLDRMPGNMPQSDDNPRMPFPRKRPRWQRP